MATAVPGWSSGPGAQAWNRVKLGGVQMPGISDVVGRFSRRDDTEAVPGQDGVTATVLGYAPAEFTITTTLWTDQHVARYQEILRRFRPQRSEAKSQAARAVEVIHPAVQMAGITQLTIYQMSVPEPQGRQIFRATTQLREFIPEVKRPNKVKKVDNASGAPQWTPPISARTTGPSQTPRSVRDLRAAAPVPFPEEPT